MSSLEIRGRFLPSRVYSRWKWTVRLGLMLVPFLIFLCGGLILFLTPNTYRSTTLFELENGPPPDEIPELLVSGSNLDRVVDHLQLTDRFDMDREGVIQILRECSIGKVMPDTRFIELSVSLTNKTDARDIAEQQPASLLAVLKENISRKNAENVVRIDELISEAADAVAEKAVEVANQEKVHGSNPADASVATVLERSRKALRLADAEVERLKSLRSANISTHLDTLPRLVVHSAPVISQSAHSPKIGEELLNLAVRSLVIGLLAALLLPYLMELAFPPREIPAETPDALENL